MKRCKGLLLIFTSALAVAGTFWLSAATNYPRYVPRAETGWSVVVNEGGAYYARYEHDLFTLDVYEFHSQMGPFTGSLHLKNKSGRRIALDTRSISLRDSRGSAIQPLSQLATFGPERQSTGAQAAQTMAEWLLSGVEEVPGGTALGGNLCFDRPWTEKRTGQEFTLLIQGLMVSGYRFPLPELRLEPLRKAR